MSALLIHGENEYQAQSRFKELINEFLLENNPESLRVFDGEDSDTTEVSQSLAAQSLFTSGHEMVAIKRLGSNMQLKEQLLENLSDLPGTTELIIYEPKIDKRSKLYKLLKKNNQTEEFIVLSEPELVRWVEKTVKDRKGTITQIASKMLTDRTKGDQIAASNELDKLLSFSRSIDEDSVKSLVELAPDDNIFDLLDKLTSGNVASALNKYDELREAQMEAHYILVMISWQLGNMLLIKLGESKTEREIASDTGMNPYTVSKTRALTSRLSRRRIQKMVLLATEADKKLKTTSVDADQLIRNLIAKI